MSFKAITGTFLMLMVFALFFTPARAQTINLVGLGDSLMAGYEIGEDEAFPARLQQRLRDKGHDVSIANAGVSGDTSRDGLARIDWSVPDGTDGVILELGANDALRGLPPEETEKNLDAMIARLRERKIAVLLVGIFAPPNLGKEYQEKFNAIYPRLAKKYGLELYPFFLDGVAIHPELQLKDGMHPNPEGTKVMAEKFLPTAEAFLANLHP